MISIIVSTYNRTDALNAVLAGLALQSGMAPDQWEVIVADDGSGPDTRSIIDGWRASFPCSLRHVWHEDVGFRLAAIRNLSAVQATGDWLVFMDGVCIPFPDFVKQHTYLAERGWFVAGNRILLSERFTQSLLQSTNPTAPMGWSRVQWLQAKFQGQTNRAMPWLRMGLGVFRKQRARRWQVLKGCNIGVSRQDYMDVNGFDESYSGWGREDSDFAIRLIRHGSLLKDGRYAVPVLHLWHQESDRNLLTENDQRLTEVLNSSRTRAKIGVDRHIPQDGACMASTAVT